jgi:hypothetical protein
VAFYSCPAAIVSSARARRAPLTVLAVLLEVVERLRRVVERHVGELWERLCQIWREVDVDAVANARVAHDVEETHALVDVRSPEQTLAYLSPVRGTLVVAKDGVRSERGPQGFCPQRGAGLHEVRVDPWPPRGHEPPRRHRVRGAAGPDPAPAHQVLVAAGDLEYSADHQSAPRRRPGSAPQSALVARGLASGATTRGL